MHHLGTGFLNMVCQTVLYCLSDTWLQNIDYRIYPTLMSLNENGFKDMYISGGIVSQTKENE